MISLKKWNLKGDSDMSESTSILNFRNLLDKHLWKELQLHTRIHPIILQEKKVFIKREDELSSGITGSKYRKYASLIPKILAEQYDEVVLIGGAKSNNIIAGMQLFKENNIDFSIYLLENHSKAFQGNDLIRNLLSKNTKVNIITREDWHRVKALADDDALKAATLGKRVLVIPEGGMLTEAIPGAMTLALDIMKNEEEHLIKFENIFIDSGTGVTAIGLILGMDYLGIINRNIHITLIAGTEVEFLENLNTFREHLKLLFGTPCFSSRNNIYFHLPPIAKSFGSINDSILKKTIGIAQDYGILMDPIYSVKHFMSMEHAIVANKIGKELLFIYNGGSIGLMGFSESLARLLN